MLSIWPPLIGGQNFFKFPWRGTRPAAPSSQKRTAPKWTLRNPDESI